jgi:thymidylate kinase
MNLVGGDSTRPEAQITATSAGPFPSEPPRSNERGAFVVLVGPDGVGKTTIARAILERYMGQTAYFHFLPTVQRRLAERPPELADAPPPKTGASGSRPIGWFRLLRTVWRSWVGYLVRIRPALRRGCLVIGDRWLYGYVVQPHALKYYGPHGLAAVMMRVLPRPDLIVNLSAPPEVIRARKQELTVPQIEAELNRWASLPTRRIWTLDAAAAPEVIARQVLEILDGWTLSGRTPVQVTDPG